MNTLSLTPLFRQSVGFDRFSDLFDSMLANPEAANSYPPYNIEKLGDDQYRITMAVAGFSRDNIDIVAHQNQLAIKGKISEPAEPVTYLHKGIATRAFERKFSLADHVKVTGAALDEGMLSIELTREIPDEQKPRMIEIASSGASKRIEAKKAN